MVCVSDILFVDGLALLGQQKDPILQILVSCHHKFGDSFPRQATEMDLSRLLDIKAPCSFCGGFLLQRIFIRLLTPLFLFLSVFRLSKGGILWRIQ